MYVFSNRCFLFFFLTIVIDAVVTYWDMAPIKANTRQNTVLDFLYLWTEWNHLLKNKNRESNAGGKRVNFLAKLDSLFDIGSPDAIQEIMKTRTLTAPKKDDDVAFYLDQKKKRERQPIRICYSSPPQKNYGMRGNHFCSR